MDMALDLQEDYRFAFTNRAEILAHLKLTQDTVMVFKPPRLVSKAHAVQYKGRMRFSVAPRSKLPFRSEMVVRFGLARLSQADVRWDDVGMGIQTCPEEQGGGERQYYRYDPRAEAAEGTKGESEGAVTADAVVRFVDAFLAGGAARDALEHKGDGRRSSEDAGRGRGNEEGEGEGGGSDVLGSWEQRVLVDVRSVAEFRELLDGGRSGVHMLLEVMSSVSCKLCQQVRAEFAEVADHMRVDAPDMVVARIDAANLKPIDPQAEEEAHYRTAFDLDGKRHGFPSIYYDADFSVLEATQAILLVVFLPMCQALKSLNISANRLGGYWDKREWISDMTGIKALAAALPECRALETITFGDIGVVTMKTDMTEADFSGKYLKASDVVVLAAFLPKCHVNNIGELVPPPGWTRGSYDHHKHGYKWSHTDGQTEVAKKPSGSKPEGAIALVNAIKDNGALASVNILSNGIGAEQANALIQIMESKSNLTTLCGFSGDETELDLSKEGLTAECAVLVANEIKNNGALTTIEFGDKQAVTMSTTITEANFSGKLRSYEAQIVAAFLPKCQALVKLNMRDNKIGGKKDKSGMNALKEMLKTNTVLQELDLSSNGLSKKDAPILADGLRTNGALVSANLLHNNIGIEQAQSLAAILKEHATLKSFCGHNGDETELDMSGNKEVGVEGAVMLAPEIAANGSLTSLNISGNSIGRLVLPEGWTAKKEGRGRRKKRVGYKHTDGREQTDHPGKPDGAIALAAAIKNNGALTSLNISANNLAERNNPDWTHDPGGLWKYRHTNGKKQDNEPSDFYLTDISGVVALADGIKNSGALTSLTISGDESGYTDDSKNSKPVTIETSMTNADFSGKVLGASGAILLAAFLPKCQALERLIFGGDTYKGWTPSVTYGDITPEPATLEVGMTEADLSNKNLGAGGAIIVGAWIAHKDSGALASVNILNNNIGAEHAQKLVAILKEHATLKSLCGNKGNQTELNMSGKQMGVDGAIMLVPEIVTNKALVTVNISNNRLYAAGTKVIAEALKDNAIMTELDISRNRHGDMSWVMDIANAIPTMGALVKLNMSDNNFYKTEAGKALGDMLAANAVLKELDVSECNMQNPESVKAFARGLSANGALAILDIRRNNIPRNQQAILKRICNSKSTNVDLK
eukprot:g1490.t1